MPAPRHGTVPVLLAGAGAAVCTRWPGFRGGPGLNDGAAAPAGVMVLQFEG